MSIGLLFLLKVLVFIGRASSAKCPTEDTALTLEDVQDSIHCIEFLLNDEAVEGSTIPGTAYKATHIIKNEDNDRSLMTLVANFDDTVILAFYGPLKYEAMLKDDNDILKTAETITLHSKKMKVSNVLNSVYTVMKSDLKEILSSFGEGKRFIITGYSIGGAMASLVALALDEEMKGAIWKNPRSFLITFGQPRVGDKRYTDVHDDVISSWRKFRFVFNKDPVVKIPAKILGWMHHSRAVYLGHEKTTMKKLKRKRSHVYSRANIINKKGITNQTTLTNTTKEETKLPSSNQNVSVDLLTNQNESSSFAANQKSALNLSANETTSPNIASNETTSTTSPANQSAALSYVANDTARPSNSSTRHRALSYSTNETESYELLANQAAEYLNKTAQTNQNSTANHAANDTIRLSNLAANQAAALNFLTNVTAILERTVDANNKEGDAMSGDKSVNGQVNGTTPKQGERMFPDQIGSGMQASKKQMETEDDGYVRSGKNPSNRKESSSNCTNKALGIDVWVDKDIYKASAGKNAKLYDVVDVFSGDDDDDTEYIDEGDDSEEKEEDNGEEKGEEATLQNSFVNSTEHAGLSARKDNVGSGAHETKNSSMKDASSKSVGSGVAATKDSLSMKDNGSDSVGSGVFATRDSSMKDTGSGEVPLTIMSRFLQLCHEKEDDVCTIKHENIIPSLLDHSLQKYAQHVLKGPGEYFTPKGKRKWSLEEAILASCEN